MKKQRRARCGKKSEKYLEKTHRIIRLRTSDSSTVADPRLIENMLAEQFVKTSSMRKKQGEKEDVTSTDKLRKNTTAYLRKKN
jgi:hypothetical protein